MKLNKRKVLVASLAVSLIAILSFSTIAWFSDEKDITNDFMIATSTDQDPDDIFSVKIWENTPESDGDTDGYTYEDILPGDVLKKEVNVENTGYYDQYIRVTVTVSDAAAWMTALDTNGATPELAQIVNGFDANKWEDCTSEVANDVITYTLYYKGILDGEDANSDEDASVVTVFTSVKIPQSLTAEQAAEFESNFTINAKAEAVQTENLGEGAKASFIAAGL